MTSYEARTQRRQSSAPHWNSSLVNIWMGCDTAVWLGMLLENKFRIDGPRIPLALLITLNSIHHTLLRGMEALVYGSRIARTTIREAPVFIIGHWRAGTTLLHELLVLDPRHTYPTTYECFSPHHFLLTERLSGPLWDLLLPRRRPMDNVQVGHRQPQEDEYALCGLGVMSPYRAVAFPKSWQEYTRYFEPEHLLPRWRWQFQTRFVNFVKRITLARPGRVILKSPGHTFRIKTMLKLFPQARFVHITRNPYNIFPSTMHMLRSMIHTFSLQDPGFVGLEEYILDTFERMYRRLEQDQPDIPPSQWHELRYEDLVADPVGEMRKLYEKLDLGSFASVQTALRAQRRRIARYRTNRYRLTPGQRQAISQRWAWMMDRYGYPVDQGAATE